MKKGPRKREWPVGSVREKEAIQLKQAAANHRPHARRAREKPRRNKSSFRELSTVPSRRDLINRN